ncbi:mitochondrial nicotinamide adenine dinucleotide transporter 2 [Trichomonascus vanleenenianus]|uniref:Rim2p n=1 Tax=Trichomonascus vanleenenianus TaxID=2268995 RepID=UPI003ECB13B0
MTIRSPPVVEDFASDENAASSPVVPTVPHRSRPDIESAKVSPWLHFVAGGAGGMAGALFTCPLDVVKTRLQSDLYERNMKGRSSGLFRGAVGHFTDTMVIIRNLYKLEGPRSLFKGLGPNLVGVIPARSINFFTYGIGKDFISTKFNNKEEATWVHLLAAANAGIVTSTATNPIWLVKTRLQLDKSAKSDNMRKYKNSWDCITKVVKKEGIRGLYKGLSASYLGVVESSLQWVLYERMKSFILRRDAKRIRHDEPSRLDFFFNWCATSGSAGLAKLTASLITYPHEVIRTRLRQAPMESGGPKYTGLVQCFKLVLKEEGFLSMYGGLTPHLLRTVPNSIIMFGTWELIIKLCS